MTTKKLIPGKIYLFEWNDTYGRQGWFDEQEIANNTPKAHLQRTVGHLIKETDDWYILATQRNQNPEFSEWGAISWIPKGTVKNILPTG